MTTDFDCTVSGDPCTNRDGTVDDSWSGTLDAGEHKIVVYPDGGGSGNYSLTISAGAPSTGGSTGTRTQVLTLVDVSRTGVSTSQTHSFTLSGPAEVDVALTGLTIDFDCRVGGSRCTNHGGTRDDSWSGDLGEGNHSVVVYPYRPGPGNYSLTVTATETVRFVATPLAGGPITLRFCEEEDGVTLEDTCVEIVIHREGNPDGGGDGGGPDGPGGPGGPTTPSWVTSEMEEQLEDAVDDALFRSLTCSVTSNDGRRWNANAALTTASDTGRIILGGLNCPGNVAYVPVLNRDQIRVCEPFFDDSRSFSDQSLTIMHEGLHLAGALHSDFGDNTEPNDHGPMEAEIRRECGY